jgi:hypothetical protein
MKRYGNYQVEILPGPGLKKYRSHKRPEEAYEVPSAVEFQFLYDPAQFGGVIAECAGAGVRRQMQEALAAKIFRGFVEVIEGQTTAGAAGRPNPQKESFVPTCRAYAAILPARNRSRADKTCLRVNKVQNAIEYLTFAGGRQIPGCWEIGVRRQRNLTHTSILYVAPNSADAPERSWIATVPATPSP